MSGSNRALRAARAKSGAKTVVASAHGAPPLRNLAWLRLATAGDENPGVWRRGPLAMATAGDARRRQDWRWLATACYAQVCFFATFVWRACYLLAAVATRGRAQRSNVCFNTTLKCAPTPAARLRVRRRRSDARCAGATFQHRVRHLAGALTATPHAPYSRHDVLLLRRARAVRSAHVNRRPGERRECTPPKRVLPSVQVPRPATPRTRIQ